MDMFIQPKFRFLFSHSCHKYIVSLLNHYSGDAMDKWMHPWSSGRFQYNLRKINFKLIWMTDGCDISSKIALRWTSLDLSDDKSTLVQVMAWCRQATSHYLNQCWPRFLPLYGVTRPQWVNIEHRTCGSPHIIILCLSRNTLGNNWCKSYQVGRYDNIEHLIKNLIFS